MATGFILVDQPNPHTAQGTYPRRGVRGRLTGTAILHTSEGRWQSGVDSLTNLVKTRADHGCYHQGCDWVDIARYYPWEWETWQDTETNNWAVGIAAACKTSDWATMPADIREGYYRNLGRMAADFVQYMDSAYGVTVPLARISGDQARAGVPGFCAHGDSGVHRSDPGADFDWPKFFKYTKAALDGTTAKEDTLSAAEVQEIKDHITAETNRTIDYIGKVLVSGYSVGGKPMPGIAAVDINNQKTVRQTLELVQKIAAAALTPEQITEALGKALENGVDIDVSLFGGVKPEVL